MALTTQPITRCYLAAVARGSSFVATLEIAFAVAIERPAQLRRGSFGAIPCLPSGFAAASGVHFGKPTSQGSS